MKKSTKKKILTLSLVVALLAIIMIGGSLAWFTAEDETVNTFTVGSIKIIQHEKQYDENNDLVDFKDNKVLLPIVNVDNPSDDVNYQDKIVTVENAGNNPAYVRTFIAFPSALDGYLHLDYSESLNDQDWGQQWYAAYFTDKDGVKYTVHCFAYYPILATGDDTPVLLEGVYLDAAVDIRDNPATETKNLEFCKAGEFSGFEIADSDGNILKDINILVLTEAVQAEGFETMGAQGALNTAFGSLNEGYHPFGTSE